MKKMVVISSVALIVGLTTGCSSEKTSGPKTVSVKKEKPMQSLELKEFGHRMARLFKTKVVIHGDDKKGKITIDYYNPDDLDRIVTFINTLERR